jgi:hypothetical protein
MGSNPFAGCTALASITVAAGNLNYKAENGMLLSKDGKTLIGYPAASGMVTLNGIETVGGSAFYGCTALTTVSLPKAASIGDYAFSGCIVLTTVSLPAATNIGVRAFAFSYTGTGPLTVTLGSTVPTLGTEMFVTVTGTKNVTVKVPSGATGYGSSPTDTTADNWGNAFRGKGWNGTSYLTGTVNSNIVLTIETYTP